MLNSDYASLFWSFLQAPVNVVRGEIIHRREGFEQLIDPFVHLFECSVICFPPTAFRSAVDLCEDVVLTMTNFDFSRPTEVLSWRWKFSIDQNTMYCLCVVHMWRTIRWLFRLAFPFHHHCLPTTVSNYEFPSLHYRARGFNTSFYRTNVTLALFSSTRGLSCAHRTRAFVRPLDLTSLVSPSFVRQLLNSWSCSRFVFVSDRMRFLFWTLIVLTREWESYYGCPHPKRNRTEKQTIF